MLKCIRNMKLKFAYSGHGLNSEGVDGDLHGDFRTHYVQKVYEMVVASHPTVKERRGEYVMTNPREMRIR